MIYYTNTPFAFCRNRNLFVLLGNNTSNFLTALMSDAIAKTDGIVNNHYRCHIVVRTSIVSNVCDRPILLDFWHTPFRHV